MESLNLNNGILAEELVSVALLEDGFNVCSSGPHRPH